MRVRFLGSDFWFHRRRNRTNTAAVGWSVEIATVLTNSGLDLETEIVSASSRGVFFLDVPFCNASTRQGVFALHVLADFELFIFAEETVESVSSVPGSTLTSVSYGVF
jgi:hypothetical protein